jgi:hypothetical protein
MSSKNSKVGAAVIARKTQNKQLPRRNMVKGRRQRRRRSNKNFTRRLIGQIGQTQSVKLCKREVWFSGTFTQGVNLQTVNKSFDMTNGPAWFKKMAALYEKYKIHGVNLYVKFGGSMTTKGMYVLTYNSNESKKSDTTKTFQELCAQKGSLIITAAKQSGALHINGSSLTGYSTTLPTEGQDSETYCFNAVIAGIPPETVDFTVEIQYIVTFYNPTVGN